MCLGRLSGCHQMPERSFFIGNYQMPLCARCTGIFVGQVVLLLAYSWMEISYAYLLLVLPMVLDGGTQFFGWRMSNQPLRLTTGLLAGFGYMGVLIELLKLGLTRIPMLISNMSGVL